MGNYIAGMLVKKLIAADVPVKHARIAILGFTFKENCPDTRNTRVIDIINELKEYGICPLVYDPVADKEEAENEYGISFSNEESLKELDAVIIAVSHDEFKKLTPETILGMYRNGKVLFDIKGMLNKANCEKAGLLYWRL